MGKKLSSIFILYLFLGTLSYSVGALDNSDRSIKLEERRKEEKKIDEMLRKPKKNQDIKVEKKVKTKSENKFLIKKITLINGESLSLKEKQMLVNKFVNKKLGLREIHGIIKELTNLYIKKGYVASRVTIPVKQNLEKGELKLQIFVGVIEKIKITWNGKEENTRKKVNMLLKAGDIVDLKKLNYSEGVITGVPKSKGTFKLKPGSKIGNTIIEGDFKGSKLGKIGLIYDNFGSKETGRHNIRLSYTHGNLARVSDNLFIQGSTTLINSSERFNRSIALDYIVPIGWWEVGGGYNYSQTKNTVIGSVQNVVNESKTNSFKLKLNRMLYVGIRSKIKLVTNLEFKNSKVYVEKALIDSTSYKSTQLNLGLVYTGSILRGSIYSKLNYTRGLGVLGADKDLESSQAKREFGKFEFYNRFYKPFKISTQNFAYELTLDSQFTGDILYSSDKFSIGGDTTVRGYRNGVVGEDGIFIRNQIYYIINPNFKSLILRPINNLKLFTGIDYGFVDNSSNKGSKKYLSRENLTSVSIGVKKDFDHGDIGVTYSLPVNEPSYIKADKSGIFYITISLFM